MDGCPGLSPPPGVATIHRVPPMCQTPCTFYFWSFVAPCPLCFISQLGKLRFRDGMHFLQVTPESRQISLIHPFSMPLSVPMTSCKWWIKDNIFKNELKEEPPVQKIWDTMFWVEGTEHVCFGLKVMESRRHCKGRIQLYLTPQRQRCSGFGGRSRNEEWEKHDLRIFLFPAL